MSKTRPIFVYAFLAVTMFSLPVAFAGNGFTIAYVRQVLGDLGLLSGGSPTFAEILLNELVLDVANADTFINRNSLGVVGIGASPGASDGALVAATLTATTTVLSPSFDTPTGVALGIGLANATALNFGKAAGGITFTFNGTTDTTILDGIGTFVSLDVDATSASSASAPAIIFGGETNLGFYHFGGAQIGIAAGGSASGFWTTGGLTLTDGNSLSFGQPADVHLIGDGTAGFVKLGSTLGSTNGTFSAAAFGARAAASDVATVATLLTGMDAYSQATSNTAGHDVGLYGGIGTKTTTVVDYTQTAYTVVVTVGSGGSTTVTTLTEGADWSNVTDDPTSATALAVAVDGISGVSAVAVSDVVHVTPDPATHSLTLSETGTGNTVSLGEDGLVAMGPSSFTHTATGPDQHTIDIIVNAAGIGDVKAIEIDYTLGALASGSDEAVILISVNEADALGGSLAGIEVLGTAAGSLDGFHALLVGATIDPLLQFVGTFGDVDGVLLNIAADVKTALSQGGGGNITVFVADDDTFTISDSATFEEIEFIVDTPASGGGVAWTFEFSTGTDAWSSFTPTDATDGLKTSGVVVWELSDISGTWATGTGTKYLIRMTRTRNVLTTAPILDLIQISSVTEYGWDKAGLVTAAGLVLDAGTVGSPAFAFAGASSNTGPYLISEDRYAIATNGVKRFDIDQAGNIVSSGQHQFNSNVLLPDDKLVFFGTGKDRFLQGELTVLVDDAATEFVAIQSEDGDAGGLRIVYTAKLTDSGGVRATKTGVLNIQTLNGTATVTAGITDSGTVLEATGTTTFVFAIDSTDDGDLEITCTTTTDLTPTAITLSWTANASGDVTLAASP